MNLLLTSVFKPFGVDDKFGREENKIELFNNQVTREQGLFSLRFFHPSFGLYFLAENINVPTTVLDFPTIKEFIKEIKKGYDYVGISFITPNLKKAQYMTKLIRKYSPKTKIILGGHGTRIENIEELIEHDYIVKGEGVYWLRKFFNEDVNGPIKHPVLKSAFSQQVMGVNVPSYSAIVVPGVGCTNGCRFCTTTHFFDKKYIPYYKTGKELYDLLVDISNKLNTNDFFIMDENFLKNKERVDELLYYMKKNDKLFTFAIFSSAETIVNFGIEKLVELGVIFVWIGLESKFDIYDKNKGIDLKQLVSELKEHGITVLGSGILFLEHHTKKTIYDDINYIIDINTDYTQFMQLGPLPQTKLYKDYKEQGKLKFDIPFEEWHGQKQIWFEHPYFTPQETEDILKYAFLKDYEINGPSLLRRLETHLKGYRKLKNSSNKLFNKRALYYKEVCLESYPLLWAMKIFSKYKSHKQRINELIKSFKQEFGEMQLRDKLKSIGVIILVIKELLRVYKILPERQPQTFIKKVNQDIRYSLITDNKEYINDRKEEPVAILS